MNKKIRPIVSKSINGFFKGYKDVIWEKFDPKIDKALEKYMREDRDQAINECNERIDGLKSHAKMWSKAGGVGGNMALNAHSEIEYLEGIVADLENGTTDHLASLYDDKINYLERVKADAGLVDAAHILYINKAIKETQKEKEQVITKLENKKQISM